MSSPNRPLAFIDNSIINLHDASSRGSLQFMEGTKTVRQCFVSCEESYRELYTDAPMIQMAGLGTECQHPSHTLSELYVSSEDFSREQQWILTSSWHIYKANFAPLLAAALVQQ
jgi:hypothetical protein